MPGGFPTYPVYAVSPPFATEHEPAEPDAPVGMKTPNTSLQREAAYDDAGLVAQLAKFKFLRLWLK